MPLTPTDPAKAQIWIRGEAPNQILDVYVPRGARGEIGPVGPQGPAVPTTMTVLETTTGPETPGATGIQGPIGPQGNPGGITVGTLLSTNNLNTITTAGVYRQDTGANATLGNNYPLAGATGILYVDDRLSGGTSVMQTWYPFTGGSGVQPRRFYKRYLVPTGIWGTWECYAAHRVDEAAGRAIYAWDELNVREQLIYGDTGIRRVEGLFVNGWTCAIASLRRVGQVVTLGLYSINPAGQTAANAFTLPLGFGQGYGGSIGMPVQAGGGVNYVQLSSVRELLPPTAVSSCTGFIHVLTWTTTDSWPTTLPGTASGTIPNA